MAITVARKRGARHAGGAGFQRATAAGIAAVAALGVAVWLAARDGARQTALPQLPAAPGASMAVPGSEPARTEVPPRRANDSRAVPEQRGAAAAPAADAGAARGMAESAGMRPSNAPSAASVAGTKGDARVAEVEPRRRRLFSSSTEQLISGFANTAPGYPPPLMIRPPAGENIAEILDTPIEIFDDDDAPTVEIKENAARMKEEIRRYMAEGGTAENFLLWYHNELSRDYEDWKSAQRHVVGLLKAGELEEAERYAAEANAGFTDRGVRNVTLPAKLVERIRGDER